MNEFHQVPWSELSRELTVFLTSHGHNLRPTATRIKTRFSTYHSTIMMEN
jgi:hypothetical protein